jgi:hypothetical protein
VTVACAPLQRRSDPPSYQVVPGTQKYTIEQVPLKSQALKVAVRINGPTVEARLAEPLQCVRSGTARYEGTTAVHYALAVTDDVVRWSAFGVAGAVAGLVAVGLARGQEFGRGAAIIGIWTVPLAGLGAFETLRARDAVEPVPPVNKPFKAKEAACPPGRSTLAVRLVGAGEAAKATLDLEWRRVGFTNVLELKPGEHLLPVVVGADGVPAAQLVRRAPGNK